MTSVAGLSSDDVAARRAAGLSNRFRPPVSRALADILRANLLTLFNAVVGGSFALLLVLGYWQDAVFGVFVIANVTIGITQEVRAKRALDRLTLLTAPGARVLRDGAVRSVPVRDVVRDDVLVLGPGDELVADAIVLEATGLGLDQSLLTGEAEPVHVEPGRELRSGSFVVAGHGLARATRVGADSYANRVATDLRSFTLVRSEVRLSLARVVRWISWIILPVSILVFNGQLQALGGWEHAFSTGLWREGALLSVAAIVSMVPQGLVLMTSVALAVGALTLSRRRVLVQELPAVEMLARVDALCFDKTGTLTDGSIVLRDVQVVEDRPAWSAALSWFGAQQGANSTAHALQTRFTRGPVEAPERTVGFSSAFRWSAASFATGASRGVWVLGAPDTVLPAGSAVRARAELSAARGLRTLVLAHRPLPLSASEAEAVAPPPNLDPVAILEFQERLRPDAAAAVAYFRAQGVRLWVLSGDGINDAPALKHADLGIAMGSGAAITRAAAHVVLLDGQFSELPRVVAEGRRVIGNVERLAKLFLTKTVYATLFAVVFGGLLWPYPLLPRQLSVVDGLTIGLPALVLALLPNPTRYRAGFLARAARFCVPSGAVVAVAVAAVVLVLRGTAHADEIPSAAVIALTLIGLWALNILCRPLDRVRLLILLGGYLGLAAAFAVPFVAEFFTLAVPSPDALVVIGGGVILGCAALELLHRRGALASRTSRGRADVVTRR